MRYFIEVAYKGTNYAGFQVQTNANTIQAEVEKALFTCCRKYYKLTGSSRTDAGVHAYQNYFHVDVEFELPSQLIYNLNAVLPIDIAVKKITRVADDAHCRFNASSRLYTYYLYGAKNPFSNEIAWYYPYKINFDLLQQAAQTILNYTDFTSFSKLHTNTHTNDCKIYESVWNTSDYAFVYKVKANRFLRGMVKGLVSTSLQVARGQITIEDFKQIIEIKDCRKVNFSSPSKGLFLSQVEFCPTVLHSDL